MIFVVRLSKDSGGALRGVVTDPRSGRKAAFADVAQLGEEIAAMMPSGETAAFPAPLPGESRP